MAISTKGIGLLRSVTNHPLRLLWGTIGLAFLIAGWRFHFGLDGDERWFATLAQICRSGGISPSMAEFPTAFVLWATMALAMMLPIATPMISTYLDIADAALRGNKQVTSVIYFVAGYTAVWLVFTLL